MVLVTWGVAAVCGLPIECLLIRFALQYSGENAVLEHSMHDPANDQRNGKRGMRHVISVLLQNEVGALTRMTGLFSTRGYNIETLNVAPTQDTSVSRVTLVVSGSDAAMAQLNTQLAKLVDVVNIHDMTLGEHFERELAIVKLALAPAAEKAVVDLAAEYGAEVLHDASDSYTLQLTDRPATVDEFIARAAVLGSLRAVARSGSVAVSKGAITLSSYQQQHRLSG